MKELKCDYCHKPIKENERYKRVVTDDTLEVGTAYFFDIIPRYYHYKCYRKTLKETKG